MTYMGNEEHIEWLLTDQILAFMGQRPPVARLYRRAELDALGAAPQVDQALVTLAEAQRVGSPAPSLWFPLEPYASGAGAQFMLPPAPLKEMAAALLQREGVALVPSPQEQDYALYHATGGGGKAGRACLPLRILAWTNLRPLFLHWGRGKVHTIYKGTRTLPPYPPGNPLPELSDPEEFRHLAYRMGTVPRRLEKDVWLNHTLRVLGATPPPAAGLLLFTGGTCLTKAWEISARFSEDIDLRFQGDEGRGVPLDLVKQEVHAHVVAAVQQQLLPLLPGGRLDREESPTDSHSRRNGCGCSMTSHYTRDPGSLQIDIAFTPGRVPWTRRAVVQIPKYTQLRSAPVITHLPCVARWAIMTDKLHAVSVMPPGADIADLRHIVDLGRWLTVAAHDLEYPFMVQQSLAESSIQDLVAGLWTNLDTLAGDPHCARLYTQFVDRMFPSPATDQVPDYQTALHQIRALWHSMCESDWDNPQRVMDVPRNSSYTDGEGQIQRPRPGADCRLGPG